MKANNRLRRSIWGFMLMVGILYLVASFVYFDFFWISDIANWPPMSRIWFVYCMGVVPFCISGLFYAMGDD
jgi:hypothetical protein